MIVRHEFDDKESCLAPAFPALNDRDWLRGVERLKRVMMLASPGGRPPCFGQKVYFRISLHGFQDEIWHDDWLLKEFLLE